MAFLGSSGLVLGARRHGSCRVAGRRSSVVCASAPVVAEFDKVWLKVDSGPTKRESGLVMQKEEEQKPNVGEVVAVGPGEMMDTGAYEPHPIKVGDQVLFNENSGRDISIRGEKFVVVRVRDVVATF